MSLLRLGCVPLVTLAVASCSFLPSIDGLLPSTSDTAAIRPVCAPRGADLERAFAGCRPGDVVLAAPPGVEEATILAARVCDFGREVVVQPQEEATDPGATLACTYAGRVRPVPE
jgi:hypothetical protein